MPRVRPQVVGNVGLYFAAFRLSLLGWNVMPTSRNARGVDLLAYDADARHLLSFQVKCLSGHRAVPLGKQVDDLLGDWWLIIPDVAADPVAPEAFILKPQEVRKRAVQDKNKGRVEAHGCDVFTFPDGKIA